MKSAAFISERVDALAQKVLAGYLLTKEEVLFLAGADNAQLAKRANTIREFFCGNKVDICCIINAKSGHCSENCKFCAQSSFYRTNAAEYPLLAEEIIAEQAKKAEQAGIGRFSLVCSGRKPGKEDLTALARALEKMQKTSSISRCASLGLLTKEEYLLLKEYGLTRVHNNLESSENYFPNVCTTHSFADKVHSIRMAQECGLEVCSGGIWGLGESLEDRIDMAFSLQKLGILSVPINILFPIKGTPFEHNKALTYEEIIRSLALYRFILPKAYLRLAGGRKLLPDGGRCCFESGANALITGDMLTTQGIGVEEDKAMFQSLGFCVE